VTGFERLEALWSAFQSHFDTRTYPILTL
jgi:hypothetical protein